MNRVGLSRYHTVYLIYSYSLCIQYLYMQLKQSSDVLKATSYTKYEYMYGVCIVISCDVLEKLFSNAMYSEYVNKHRIVTPPARAPPHLPSPHPRLRSGLWSVVEIFPDCPCSRPPRPHEQNPTVAVIVVPGGVRTRFEKMEARLTQRRTGRKGEQPPRGER